MPSWGGRRGHSSDIKKQPMSYKKASRTPVTHTAVEHIQRMILGGELEADQRLPSQIELSQRLGISRASLREAISTLETLGFLRIEPGRGTFVSSRNPTMTGMLAGWRFDERYAEREVFQVRLYIECLIVHSVAPTITAGTLKRLREGTRGMREGWKRHDLLLVTESDIAFHQALIDSCGLRMLRDMYEWLRAPIEETHRHPIPITRPARTQESIGEHVKLYAALERRDADQAARAMQEHIEKTALCVGITLQAMPGLSPTTVRRSR
jgi:GntR family transcriptional repressor for pyruvate dehydrogenase complex